MNIGIFIFFTSILSIQPIMHGCSRTDPTINQGDKNPTNMIPTEGTSPIQIKPIVLELPEGHKLGRIGMGVLCIPMTDLKSIGGKAQVSENDFTDVVRTELENADYDIIDDSSINYQPPIKDDELVLQGTVKGLKVNLCFPKSGFRSWKISRGEAYVEILWQVRSKSGEKILFESITEGSEKLKEAIGYGSIKVILASVAIATRNLIADKQFNKAVARKLN